MEATNSMQAEAGVLATYRVQLWSGFGFDKAAAIAGYLHDLGVTHLYASPYLQAAAGSTHGYDVVDPTHVNRELGGAEGHARMGAALQRAGLGQVLDVVPNHMAITGRDNVWWWDVLENGPSSVYAAYFDVDWDPPESKLRNLVLLPILGDHYGRVLEAGELQVHREGGGFTVCYFDQAAPIAPRSLDTLLEAAANRLPASTRPGAPASDGEYLDSREQLESLATAFGRLPPSWATDRQSVRERHRDKEVIRSRLDDLCRQVEAVAQAIDAEVATVNADPDRLDALLERQNYRLAYWKSGGQELDYRRFFDIATLAGLRVEDDQVFADSHVLILQFLADGVIDGVRIDHIDGLREPAAYLQRLVDAAPGAWVVVEKILEAGESLPPWPVAGTTGYDWLATIGAVLVDPRGEAPLRAAYASFSGEGVEYAEIVYTSKRLVLRDSLAPDINRLTELLRRICDGHRRYRDYARRDLYNALAEVAANFPVYRTYVTPGAPPSASDRITVAAAVDSARKRRPDLDSDLLDFIADLLLLQVPGDDECELALRFQQLTGPVMAKGVEDTTFYRYMPLVSLNEVGADPSVWALSPGTFHTTCVTAQRDWPRRMLTSSTHDTKRSEDVRARINVLSELGEDWPAIVERWAAANNAHRQDAGPDRNTEWLIYETLVGAWPITAGRLITYLDKATKEAKVHTSWTDPAVAFEDSVHHFVEGVLSDASFVADVEAVVAGLRRPGWINSLALKLITLTAPGVPDLYQGSELWDLSLVDPDNRRPVDFDVRRELLASLSGAEAAHVWAGEDGAGRSKLLVVSRALQVRRRRPDCFGPGEAGRYEPLVATGPAAEHVVAFSRGGKVVTVAPRLPIGLSRLGGWGDTAVEFPDGVFHDELGDRDRPWSGPVALADLLDGFPVALLVAQ